MTPIVQPDEFLHGLRCSDCYVELKVGDPYSERLEAFQENLPVTKIICTSCATKQSC